MSMTLACFVDGSLNADKAFNQAVRWKQEDDTLYLVHTIICQQPGQHGHMRSMVDDEGEDQEAAQKICMKGQSILDRYLDFCQKNGLKKVKPYLLSANSKQSAVQFLKDHKVDYCYTGHRGIGKLKRMLYGSFSSFLVQHAPCNVCVIKK